MSQSKVMRESYGPYPVLDTFSHDHHSPQVPDNPQAFYVTQPSTRELKLRRHAACDECRKRKLKCTGDPSGCSRCVKNSIPCIYSQQKQMGRPRKRQKTDDESQSPVTEEPEYVYPPPPLHSVQAQPVIEPETETPIDPSLSNIDQDLTDFHNVCTAPLAQIIRGQREVGDYEKIAKTTGYAAFAQNGDTASFDYSSTQYPTDISQWPDFSTLDRLPLPLTTKYHPDPSHDMNYTAPLGASTDHSEQPLAQSHYDPDADPSTLSSLPAIPACPCLPNLYLSLSTLSTLTAYPISQETIDTLLSAHKTAHSVIYCPVCPREFQTGSQNLMLGCTLLNVLADAWHRIRNTPPETLKKGFSPAQSNGHPSTTSDTPYLTLKEGQSWRAFVRQLIRAYVFGDATVPIPPSPSSPSIPPPPPTPSSPSNTTIRQSPTVPEKNVLNFLIAALERRQRQWHTLDPPTDEFPDRGDCTSHSGPLGENTQHHHHHHHHHHHRHSPKPYANGDAGENEIGDRDRDRDRNRSEKEGTGDAGRNATATGNEDKSEDGKRDGADGVGSTTRTPGGRRGHGHWSGDDREYSGYLCIGIVHQSRNIVRQLDDDHH